jgi:hypothetical protein
MYCTNTFNDSQTDYETQFIYGVTCSGQRTMVESYDVSTCGCTKYDTIGAAPGVFNILMKPDCVTLASGDFWTKITCHQ